ncbi:MAG TPA: 3'-5' exonuclease [Terrimicrobiaceae bacterium]|nr:3'-5' exonuclease [Terrimicrobiaceae bacterium]
MRVSGTAFAAIDFESAGTRPGGTEVPVQIGIAAMRGLTILPEESFGSFLFTEEPITWSAQKVHGITAGDLAGAPSLLGIWPVLKEKLADRWLVAHGAATEKRFLRAFPLHGFGPWIDTLKLSRALWPDRPSFALGDLIRACALEEALRAAHPAFRWHDALSDALASLFLLRHMITEAGIADEDAAILLRPDDSPYHRAKAQERR